MTTAPTTAKKKHLITAALPYANGPIHMGHLLEHVQTDVWARALRSLGQDAVFLCAADTHGTPIEVNARKQGIAPEELVARFAAEHAEDFKAFQVQHELYGSTHTPENERWSGRIYEALKAAGHIERRPVEQAFCENDQRFLPDRFIKGTCPNCASPDQYGDVCERCGKTYSPTDLKEPKCALCGTPPTRRSSDHLFVKLSHFTPYLQAWTGGGALDTSVRNSLQPWFEQGLSDWDISRDGPYFGFPIPGEVGKFFYVWLDAPVGYASTTERWLAQARPGEDVERWWGPQSDVEISHVIGKDIVYFHTLFWPAMLKGAQLAEPKRVVVHGMLTVDGEKMSKSRGTSIAVRDYLALLDPAYLRWFFASQMGPEPFDIDLSLEEFRNRVNAELVNNLGNLANRALAQLATKFESRVAAERTAVGLTLAEADGFVARAAVHFEKLELRLALGQLVELGAWANKYVADRAPWSLIKSGKPEDVAAAHRDLSFAAEVLVRIAALLAPVVPQVSEALFAQLAIPAVTLAQLLDEPGRTWLPAEHRIGTPKPLIARLEAETVKKLMPEVLPAEPKAEKVKVEKPKAERPEAAKVDAPKVEGAPAAASPFIGIEDFSKVELRAGKVLSCERVPKADKLLHLKVDLGEASGPRTILSGIAGSYAPEQMVGKTVVVVANLAPRKMRGIDSQGMVLAVNLPSAEGERLHVVELPAETAPGTAVK